MRNGGIVSRKHTIEVEYQNKMKLINKYLIDRESGRLLYSMQDLNSKQRAKN